MAFIRVSDVVEKHALGTSLVVQGLELLAPKAGGLCSIPGQGIRPHGLPLRKHRSDSRVLQQIPSVDK